MTYGTWSTVDAPTENHEEAFHWLKEEFLTIDGNVRTLWNDHDFGRYLSFEIDRPENGCEHDGIVNEELCSLCQCEWDDAANAIEEEYSNKFF